MTALLGLDAGNTGVKAVLFDRSGRELASARRDTGGTSPAPGWVERDIGRLRRDAVSLIAEVLDRAGIPGSDVAAIGTSGHGNGLFLVEPDGTPVVAIQSLDSRAAPLVEAWTRDGTAAAAAAIACQRPWPSQTPTLLAWMKRHRPDQIARAGRLLFCKDVVTHALTGRFVTDVSDMGGAGLLALPDNAFTDDLAAVYGLSDLRHLLPDMLWPTDVAGRVTPTVADRTGLRAGTPVVAGFFDVIAAAVGTGVTRPGQASVIIGTWSINQAVAERPVPDVFMSCGMMPGRFMVMENSATSAVNLEWAAHHILGGHAGFATADRLAAEAPLTADAPFYLPFLYGSADNARARAGMVGVAGWHGAADLVRALFEGVAFAHVEHVRRLRVAGVEAPRLTLSGGGARSPVWPQMLADILGEPVEVSTQPEAGALGAAMAAGVGAGHFESLDAAAAAMAAPSVTIEPDPGKTALYRKRHMVWLSLEKALAPTWRALGDINHDD